MTFRSPGPRRAQNSYRATLATVFTASLSAGLLSAGLLSAPAIASAQTMSSSGAQTDAVDSIILGVGATESEVMLTWMSSLAIRDEYAVIAPTAEMNGEEFPESAQIIPAQQELTRVARYANDVKITGLDPATDYTYKVGSDSHGWSTNSTFTTGHTGDEWNFLFYGDPQLGSGELDADTAGWHNTVARSTAQFPDSSFLLSAGDQVDSVLQKEHRAFKSAPQLRSYPVAVNNGNHDVLDFQLYRQNYSWPNVANEHTERNYFFEHNNALVISLDGNQSLPSHIDKHAAYVKDVVAKHGGDKDWIITTFHQPPFSQAYHMDDLGAQKFRESLTPALSEAGVDVVLNGHDHIYTRTHLMKGNAPVVPAGLPAQGDILYPEDDEVLYLTGNSSSGSKFYPFWKNGTEYDNLTVEESREQDLMQDWTAMWNQDYTPNYSNIQLSDQELTVTTYNAEDGTVVDEVTLSKQEDPTGPHETPADSLDDAPSSLSSTSSALATGGFGSSG